jgi:hypothetical protein
MELPWAPAARAGDMVIEANFATARYNARPTHPVHVLKTLPLSTTDEYDRPAGIGTLVTVDTTVPVDIGAVAAEVRRLHEAD